VKAAVRATGLGKTFRSGGGAVAALSDVTVEIRTGELTLLVGPSGSGKTTLLCLAAGLLQPTSGDVELCGIRLNGLGETAVARVRRERLGFVFQHHHLFPALSAIDNVAQVLELKGSSRAAARRRAAEVLGRVGLAERLEHRPGTLSGGEAQRVAIARAICDRPSVVLGDEVTASLDAESAAQVADLLRAEVASDRAVVLVTHDQRLERVADRVITLADGRVVGDHAVGAPS